MPFKVPQRQDGGNSGMIATLQEKLGDRWDCSDGNQISVDTNMAERSTYQPEACKRYCHSNLDFDSQQIRGSLWMPTVGPRYP